jgi:hypothetical protein
MSQQARLGISLWNLLVMMDVMADLAMSALAHRCTHEFIIKARPLLPCVSWEHWEEDSGPCSSFLHHLLATFSKAPLSIRKRTELGLRAVCYWCEYFTYSNCKHCFVSWKKLKLTQSHMFPSARKACVCSLELPPPELFKSLSRGWQVAGQQSQRQINSPSPWLLLAVPCGCQGHLYAL